MSQLTATDDRAPSTHYGHPLGTDELDLLVDTITGDGRAALADLSVAHIYNVLAAQITAMGMRPAEQKLLRIAYWIATP